MKVTKLIMTLPIILICVATLETQVCQSKNTNAVADDDSEVRPPVTKYDLEIVRRARKILNSPARWNRADNRICPSCAKTFSLYCALKKAADELNDGFKHRSAVMQEARFVIDEIGPKGHHYEHRLMNYNNDPLTKFSDIQKVLGLMEVRISKRLAEDSHGGAK